MVDLLVELIVDTYLPNHVDSLVLLVQLDLWSQKSPVQTLYKYNAQIWIYVSEFYVSIENSGMCFMPVLSIQILKVLQSSLMVSTIASAANIE
jgi:hypothetical protein